jgi:hypothetical protein
VVNKKEAINQEEWQPKKEVFNQVELVNQVEVGPDYPLLM